MKIMTAIEFAPGEAIDSVLMGDSESWQVTRLQNGHVLAVKPLIEGARTNMTVYTSQNTYTFELRAVGVPAGSASLNYRIGFRYPERERAKTACRQVEQARPRIRTTTRPGQTSPSARSPSMTTAAGPPSSSRRTRRGRRSSGSTPRAARASSVSARPGAARW